MGKGPNGMRTAATFGFCLAGLMAILTACEPPVAPEPVGAAVVEPDRRDVVLPDAVAATVARLRQLAMTGTYRDLAKFADTLPGFISNHAGMSHRDYWYLKLRAGDWPMVRLEEVLQQAPAVADTREGRVFIWPRHAKLAPAEIMPADAREIDRLLGQGAAATLKQGAPWPGYVLGIAESGDWLYFVSGAG